MSIGLIFTSIGAAANDSTLKDGTNNMISNIPTSTN